MLIDVTMTLMFHYTVIDEKYSNTQSCTSDFWSYKSRSFTLSLGKNPKELSIQLERYEISLLTKLSVHTCNNNSNQKRPVHTRSIIHVTNESCCTSDANAFDIYTPLRGILQNKFCQNSQLSFRSADFSKCKYLKTTREWRNLSSMEITARRAYGGGIAARMEASRRDKCQPSQ